MVAQLVEALCYKSEGAGSIPDDVIDIDIMLRATLWPWDCSACSRNEYQEYFLGGGGL